MGRRKICHRPQRDLVRAWFFAFFVSDSENGSCRNTFMRWCGTKSCWTKMEVVSLFRTRFSLLWNFSTMQCVDTQFSSTEMASLFRTWFCSFWNLAWCAVFQCWDGISFSCLILFALKFSTMQCDDAQFAMSSVQNCNALFFVSCAHRFFRDGFQPCLFDFS